jgi:hypothetical protein
LYSCSGQIASIFAKFLPFSFANGKAIPAQRLTNHHREIAEIAGEPEASVSPQFRNRQKPGFGAWKIDKESRVDLAIGIWEIACRCHNIMSRKVGIFSLIT